MDKRIVEGKMWEYIRGGGSGVEAHREYLGMSQIGRCPALLYKWFTEGKGAQSDRAHLNCISGNMYERKMLGLLAGAGIVEPMDALENNELIAPFDARFRGHVDGVTLDGELVEVKTFRADEFSVVKQTGKVKNEYYWQVQAYMRYGDFDACFLVAVSREPFEFCVLYIRRDEMLGTMVEAKAKRVLAAIDAGTPPACECGHCATTNTYTQTQTTRIVRDQKSRFYNPHGDTLTVTSPRFSKRNRF